MKKDLTLIISRALPKILDRAGLIIQGRAVQMAPIDLGALRNSIDYKIEGNSVLVGSDVSYAVDMEFGRPPGKAPSIEEITPWAQRHGISPFAVQRAIKKRGIPVGTVESPLFRYGTFRPFLRPAMHRSIRRIKEVAAGIINKEIDNERVK